MTENHYCTKPLLTPDNAPAQAVIVTCMRNEGPFILEWVAYQLALGFTKIIVYTNDCDDGTPELLQSLEKLGIVEHYENQAAQVGTTRIQQFALEDAWKLPHVYNADYVYATDVDEFLHITLGEGRLCDLFNDLPEFDFMSINELIHSSSGISIYKDEMVITQFGDHAPLSGEWFHKRQGVKTIIKNTALVENLSVHRPILKHPARKWIDGSGGNVTERIREGKGIGMPRKGRCRYVFNRHYPLRSVESYMTKAQKTRVSDSSRAWSYIQYFIKRSRIAWRRSTPPCAIIEKTKANIAALKAVAEIEACHQNSVRAHEMAIAEISRNPELFIDFKRLKRASSRYKLRW